MLLEDLSTVTFTGFVKAAIWWRCTNLPTKCHPLFVRKLLKFRYGSDMWSSIPQRRIHLPLRKNRLVNACISVIIQQLFYARMTNKIKIQIFINLNIYALALHTKFYNTFNIEKTMQMNDVSRIRNIRHTLYKLSFVKQRIWKPMFSM